MAQIITFKPLKVSTSEVSGDGTTSEQLVETINGTFNSLTKDYQYTILGMPSTLLPSSGIITNSVVYCTDLRKFKKFNGTSWVDEIVDIQTATELQNGIAKLYNSTGQNVDGGVTQRLFTNETQEIALDMAESKKTIEQNQTDITSIKKYINDTGLSAVDGKVCITYESEA